MRNLVVFDLNIILKTEFGEHTQKQDPGQPCFPFPTTVHGHYAVGAKKNGHDQEQPLTESSTAFFLTVCAGESCEVSMCKGVGWREALF